MNIHIFHLEIWNPNHGWMFFFIFVVVIIVNSLINNWLETVVVVVDAVFNVDGSCCNACGIGLS